MPKSEASPVERTFSRARHLTVHYAERPGELVRILRDARDLEARAWIRDEPPALRYLWPQDVMANALWPTVDKDSEDLRQAVELTQAFADLFTAALPPYLDRMGVDLDEVTLIRHTS